VSMRVFVREPYDKLVHADSRFWNTSGLSVTMGAEGMHIELQSLQALLSGGITFETPAASASGAPADDESKFHLYDDKARADAASYRENIPYVSYFETSIQGLSQGSPVQLFGVQIGNVSSVTLVYDADKHRMVARVAFNVQPERVLSHGASGAMTAPDVLRRALSETGLRAQLESSSFLTGAKDIAILWTPGNRPSELPHEGDALVLPGEGGGLDGLTASLSDVAAKVDKIPFEKIGESANSALSSVQQLASNVNANATPALQQLPLLMAQLNKTVENAGGAMGANGYGQNSEFQHGMERAMNQVNDAARSFRALADYLDRHPEALIRGRASSTEGR
jgi:paraquat-inducible protein B